MAKKGWEILITILGIALDVAMLVKDKFTGGKHDRSGTTKEE
jgi:hypothetical protein